MKIKKGLALILALAMIITLMPTMAFATTTNTVSRVVTVGADDPITSDTLINLETKDDWVVNLEAKPAQTGVQTIRLTLENAEWNQGAPTADTLNNVLRISHNSNVDADSVTAGVQKIELGLEFISASDNSLEFSITPDATLPSGTDVTLTIPANAIIAGTEEGAVQVSIDGLDSQISNSALTIANVATSVTTATVTGTVKTFPRGNNVETGTTIEIRETAINSLLPNSEQTIQLTLPRDVSWADIEIGGNLANNPEAITPKLDVKGDGRTAQIIFTVPEDSGDVRNVMTIKPSINIGKNADAGDITVSLVGVSATLNSNTVTDTDDLVIAAYGDESVEITTEEEVPTIVSGYVTDTKNKKFTVSVTLEETMVDSLADGRYVDFDLPEEVQICGEIKAKVNKKTKAYAEHYVTINGIEANPESGTKIDLDTGTEYGPESTASKNAVDIFTTDDTSGFEFEVPNTDGNADITTKGDWEAEKANTITFEIPVTVEAGFTGDITMTVTGARAGVEDTELVVATAEVPVTVETQTTNVKNGVQTQAVADITIKENFAGYIDDENGYDTLILDVDTLGLSKSMVFESCDNIEVTDGNLEIGEWDIVNDANGEPRIEIPIKRESTRESTIELTGLTMVLNRTLPEGGYDLSVSGGAVVQNGEYNDGDFSGTAATVEDYVVITTPADDSAGVNATFTAGQASYTVDGQTVTMDVAPFIDSNNRMLVPIRYAANAMGVSDSNIQWNGYTQTGTISGAQGVVQVTVGSTNLITSNGTITMDTVAVNTNDRIYVPVRYIANALGASVEWDPATRTATFS